MAGILDEYAVLDKIENVPQLREFIPLSSFAAGGALI
jgi:hypothetical protein